MGKSIDNRDGLIEATLARQAQTLRDAVQQKLRSRLDGASENIDWIFSNIPPYFFITMKDEISAIADLAIRLNDVANHRRVTLIEQENKLIVAQLDIPGSVYETTKHIQEKDVSYAELTHSLANVPGADRGLEILRFEFERKTHEQVAQSFQMLMGAELRNRVRTDMKRLYPDYDFSDFDRSLCLLWSNNESYVRISPPERIARALWLYEQSIRHDGLFLDLETVEGPYCRCTEYRLLFSVVNPPEKGFMTQVSEVFRRLRIGVQRSYSLNMSTGTHRQFIGTFYVMPSDGSPLKKESELFDRLQTELYNTQILSMATDTYSQFLAKGLLGGKEASLTNAFIAFCHTNLAHNQPDRFSLSRVVDTFLGDADTTLKLIDLFTLRFDPGIRNRRTRYQKALRELEQAVDGYNTGYKYLDTIRKRIFHTCLLFIRHVLKTNFFVSQKHALAFRLDPSYLKELPDELTSDLVKQNPFRITFFFARYGLGYHIGFSDIARGGWRTIICSNSDEYVTNMNTLFREVFVLAHTQHLKNKDIYEGGSKLAVVLNADGCSQEEVEQRLYKLQYGFINAFLDIFVTKNGIVENPLVVDYYREDEPIELGPDENMHDAMIELIAAQARKRGYALGSGIISSKRAGINHKEYGVTSRGVVRFAEIAMREIGLDMRRSAFTVKMTGGPTGDVAGNAIKLLCDRCPRVRFRAIVDAAGGLYDPRGAKKEGLQKLFMKQDIVAFDPKLLHPGGFVLFRTDRRKAQLRELHRKLVRTAGSVEEHWITTDEFHREIEDLVFATDADLFLPCGGRPETIDSNNWQRLLKEDGAATMRVITEGANSFLTPEARIELQKKGVIVLRDASANKCGVIASSYEIIANLLMTEREFYNHKEAYVQSVMEILDKRVEQEANTIFERYRKKEGHRLFTEISNQISREINHHYDQLVAFFQGRPDLPDQPLFRKVLLNHMPGFIREHRRFRSRVRQLPLKMKTAILASELASYIVYHGGWESPMEDKLKRFVKESFSLQ